MGKSNRYSTKVDGKTGGVRMVDEVVEIYLHKIERELEGLEIDEKNSTLAELESHILDRAQEMARKKGLKEPTTEIYERVIQKLGDPVKIGKGLRMTELKYSSIKNSFIDHPAPSVFIFSCLLFGFLGCVFGFLALIWKAPILPIWVVILLGIILILGAIICAFYIWPIYATYYTVASSGITVKYGPWERTYPWDVFERASIQKGLFSSRIGWASVTPCVRLTDAVVLKRREGWSLYLTPNDITEFLRKVSLFAEDLTKEAIF
jgi:uncharacterized membrane protein